MTMVWFIDDRLLVRYRRECACKRVKRMTGKARIRSFGHEVKRKDILFKDRRGCNSDKKACRIKDKKTGICESNGY